MTTPSSSSHGRPSPADLPLFTPAIDVVELADRLLLLADLPGVPQGAANVSLDQEHLVIEGVGPRARFRRELVVPRDVDGERVAATLAAGVLTVTLPRRRDAARAIPVQTS